MKAAIFNPYLDTLGGGERYTMSFAKVLEEAEYDVFVQWPNEKILKKLSDRFGFDLSDIKITKDIKRGDGYDLCFWVSDGSIPLLRARKNILHFQIPFRDVSGKSLLNRMKLFRINKVICNSNFTKKIIDGEYGTDSMVIYPPVDVDKIKPKKKRNIILAVGRFSRLAQAKRHDILISCFKSLTKKGLKGWKLVLAGGVEVGVDEEFLKLKKNILNYPIEIIESPKYDELVKLYSQAKLFWSASGFDTDEISNPEKSEHFGISVVEAMTAGAVPLIFNSGGHKEIVKDGISGFLWSTKSNLISKTLYLINQRDSYNEISQNAQKRSQDFSYENFRKGVQKII